MDDFVIHNQPKRGLGTVAFTTSGAVKVEAKPLFRAGACAMCGAPSAGGRLSFVHEHSGLGERVELDIQLCEPCGDRLEKHLKRAIPKRLMTFTNIIPPPTI